jgi:signal transduction histidine kinase
MPQTLALIIAALGLVALVGSAFVMAAARRRSAATAARLDEARSTLGEADAIKNDFVTMISHEFRTPLASVGGFSEILAGWRDLPPDEIDEFLGLIGAETARLAELVEEVLVIPRLEAGRLKLDLGDFDLSLLIHEMAEVVFKAADKEVAVSIPGGIDAHADRRRVEQVMRNLLENAKLYGGDQVLIEGFPLGDHFVVVVSDNGPGIPPDSVDAIFEHFEQISKGDARSSQGLGVGLAISRRLARAMGGDVWYERRFPTGSRFCFSIPQFEASPETEPAGVETDRR